MKFPHAHALAGLAASAALGAPAVALAHDIWVVPVPQDGKIVAHVRYADPGRLELAERGKVVSLEVISPGGKINLKRPLKPAKAGAVALETAPFTAPPASILAVAYDNGFWTTDTADGVESNTSKSLVAKPGESWWVPKYGKTLLGPGSYTVSSHALVEITPLSEPYAVPVGGDLAVKVERQGQPLAGVKLTYGDGLEPNPEEKMPSVTTGKDGVARIPVSRKGPYLITTHQEGPPSFPAMADKDDVYASLAFDTAN